MIMAVAAVCLAASFHERAGGVDPLFIFCHMSAWCLYSPWVRYHCVASVAAVAGLSTAWYRVCSSSRARAEYGAPSQSLRWWRDDGQGGGDRASTISTHATANRADLALT